MWWTATCAPSWTGCRPSARRWAGTPTPPGGPGSMWGPCNNNTARRGRGPQGDQRGEAVEDHVGLYQKGGPGFQVDRTGGPGGGGRVRRQGQSAAFICPFPVPQVRHGIFPRAVMLCREGGAGTLPSRPCAPSWTPLDPAPHRALILFEARREKTLRPVRQDAGVRFAISAGNGDISWPWATTGRMPWRP